MNKRFLSVGYFFTIAVAILLAAIPAAAQTAPITTVVTVLGPKYTAPPAISKDDIAGRHDDIEGRLPVRGGPKDMQVIRRAIPLDLLDRAWHREGVGKR